VPNRIIRESICNSPSLEQLSPGAEVLFYRLLTRADDFGLFEADPLVVLGGCFPLRIGKLKPREVAAWLAELDGAEIVLHYRTNGRTYGQFINFNKYNRLRSKNPKHPLPPAPGPADLPADDSTCCHVTADDSRCQHLTADASTCQQMLSYADAESDADADTDTERSAPSAEAERRAAAWWAWRADHELLTGSATGKAKEKKLKRWAQALDRLARKAGWGKVDEIIALVNYPNDGDDFWYPRDWVRGPPKLLERTRDKESTVWEAVLQRGRRGPQPPLLDRREDWDSEKGQGL